MRPHPRSTAVQRGVIDRFRATNQGGGAQGPKGDSGNVGLSAYQVAVANGFVGSEAQWLDSLVGPAGDVDVSFETVSRNLDAADAAVTTNSIGVVTEVTYSNGVVKSFTFTGGGLIEALTLSGTTPNGIDLVNTFTYDGDDLTAISYT